MAKGMVIEGNMGSHIKTDYTIIGDAVNTAARLEGLTRQVKRSLVVSELVRHSTKEPWNFICLGEYDLRGKEENGLVYSIDHELASSFQEKDILRDDIQRLAVKRYSPESSSR